MKSHTTTEKPEQPNLTPLEKITQWQQAIQSERENLVEECQHQFAKAVALLKTIEELGVDSPFEHPSLVTFKSDLEKHFTASPMPLPSVEENPRRSQTGSTRHIILSALSDGKDTPKRVLSDRCPSINPATLNQTLTKLVKEKEIENPERGYYRLATK